MLLSNVHGKPGAETLPAIGNCVDSSPIVNDMSTLYSTSAHTLLRQLQ